MYPILFKAGPITLYTYGLMIAIGILVAIGIARREGRWRGLNPDRLTDLAFYLVMAGIVGSRLLYVVTTPEMFINDPLEIFRIWNGGLVFYGAFIAAFLVGMGYVRVHRLPLWKTADSFAPAVAAAHVFGRLGCLFAGCCYGKVCDLPWAIRFIHPATLARPIGVDLHPTQLYSSLNNLAIFVILMALRRRMKFDGQLFWIYIILYGITRSIIETFRADFRGAEILGLFSMSQTIGWSMAVLAVTMLVILNRRSPSRENA